MLRLRAIFGLKHRTAGKLTVVFSNFGGVVLIMSCFLCLAMIVPFRCDYTTSPDYSMWGNCWTATTSTAAIYYNSQRSLFLAAARGYDLHWAFAQGRPLNSTLQHYDDMVVWRFSSMVHNLRAWARDDAKIEKDKCLLSRFLAANGIPQVPLLYTSSGKDSASVVKDVYAGLIFRNITRFPVFMKACHLSGGGGEEDGLLKIQDITVTNNKRIYASKNKVGKAGPASDDDFVKWVELAWSKKAVDTGRKWEGPANILTADLAPGFMLQASAQQSDSLEGDRKIMYEVKTCTFWGRSFAAMLLADGDPVGPILLHGHRFDDVELSANTGLFSLFYAHKLIKWQLADVQWIVDEGHGACIWPLAEKAAQAMRIDEVRIDIFITRGQPEACVVNEISLSSGMGQGAFRGYMGKLWAEPHVERSYRVWGSAMSEPVYLMKPVHA